MSIRDIIAGATPGPWEASDPNRLTGECSIAKRSAQGLLLSISNVSIDPHNARFIATFDPEHVALMEALCEADDPEPGPIHCQLCGGAGVMSLRDCERCGGSGREPSWQRWKARQDLRDALTAYRKERGL